MQDFSRRERKGGTSIFELAQFFHFPINEAAKQLKICPTVLKKICRRHGLRRWPHRKLQSIDRTLGKLRPLLDLASNDVNQQHYFSLKARISNLETERRALCFEDAM